MANIKSQKKRALTNKKAEARNLGQKQKLKQLLKMF